jgi:hypothetical protein
VLIPAAKGDPGFEVQFMLESKDGVGMWGAIERDTIGCWHPQDLGNITVHFVITSEHQFKFFSRLHVLKLLS